MLNVVGRICDYIRPILGLSCSILGLPWVHLGPSWGHRGVILGHPAELGHLEAIVKPYWAILGPI
jgi:hypothetical protein